MPTPPDPLRRLPLLAHLGDRDREALVTAGRVRALGRGETLFREGERAEAMYGLLAGLVKLYRTTPDGRELLLHLVHPGESFAEAALFQPEAAYPASALAVEESRVWCLPRATLVGLLRASPDLGLAMLGSVSRWTRRLAAKLEFLTQRRVEERLAAFLHGRARRRPIEAGDEVDLDEPRHLIAAQIGTVPEVLSRTLRRLEEEGIASFGARSARVLDPAALRLLAFGAPEPADGAAGP